MLLLAEKILQWEFEETNAAPSLPGTFAKGLDLDDFDREDGPSSAKKTYVVFPKNWQPVVGSSEVLWLFFMVCYLFFFCDDLDQKIFIFLFFIDL